MTEQPTTPPRSLRAEVAEIGERASDDSIAESVDAFEDIHRTLSNALSKAQG